MSKFKIGDRVRFVRNENEYLEQYVGTEGVITGRRRCCNAQWKWRPDKPFYHPPSDNCIYSPDEHLEPAQSSPLEKPAPTKHKHEPSTWEKCGFHPKQFIEDKEHDSERACR